MAIWWKLSVLLRRGEPGALRTLKAEVGQTHVPVSDGVDGTLVIFSFDSKAEAEAAGQRVYARVPHERYRVEAFHFYDNAAARRAAFRKR